MEVFGGRCVSHGLAEKLPKRTEKPKIAAQLLNPIGTPYPLLITSNYALREDIPHLKPFYI